ncbi:MAG: YgiQ family radical SAM protein [Lachnospiraceae bacterium]|nr:YgiQ family radical SAM protein [Lachnospiraceae bacterium]
MAGFLPLSKEEMKKAGIKQPDFVYVTGDAYVDHPSFGSAIISRILVSRGYTVCMISQPDWKNDSSITEFGEPRLAFLVSAGNMDSMVNHYTVSKKRREKDSYTPGGVMGKRPDYATIVYSNLIRRTYKKTPILIGGIEASLRRLAHYDYWSDKLKRSVLMDSGADILMYGMGERAVVELAEALDAGISVKDITFVRGTVYRTDHVDDMTDTILLPEFESLQADRKQYAKSFYTQYCNTDPFSAKRLVEAYPNKQFVVQNPPSMPLSVQEMDDVYALPYMRTYHPSYEKDGGVAAIEEVKFSLICNRGCFGGCSFCALTFHQGRMIQTRSKDSVVAEAEMITKMPDFKGYIHDVGGPTANFFHKACHKQEKYGVCTNRQCLFPEPCKNLIADHREYLELLRRIRKLPGVKKVFVRSGIRFDYLLCDKDDTFFRELCKYHISGQLKVAPEHVSDRVLSKMGKPKNAVYQAFAKKYEKLNQDLGKKQYLVPYLMSSHPGSDLKAAVELAEHIRDIGYMPQQVQDFYPTPSTISTVMYYTGVDPRDMQPVYVPHNPHEKAMQRALIQYRNPDNYDLVKEALIKAGRGDLIGFGENCLIPPRKMAPKQAGLQTGKGKKAGSQAGQKTDFGGKDRARQGRSGRNTADEKRQGTGKYGTGKGPVSGRRKQGAASGNAPGNTRSGKKTKNGKGRR